LRTLPLNPETRLRITIEEARSTELPPLAPFTPTEFRNGLPLLPRRELPEPITLDLVKRLIEEENEEVFHAYRTT
jgi:hypothetical protein